MLMDPSTTPKMYTGIESGETSAYSPSAGGSGSAASWMLPALMGLSTLAGSYGRTGQSQNAMMLPMMLMMMQDRRKKAQQPTAGPLAADYSNPAAQAAMQPPVPQSGPAAGLPMQPVQRESPYQQMMHMLNQPYPDQYGHAGF